MGANRVKLNAQAAGRMAKLVSSCGRGARDREGLASHGEAIAVDVDDVLGIARAREVSAL
jgi:hypothetical protein